MSSSDRNQAGGRSDDLKLIPGIGGGVEARLNAAGIHTYAQMAALTPEALAEILKDLVGITPARIARQEWIEQAGLFAGEQETESTQPAVSSRQYYETFTVELLLDEEHSVRRMRLTRVQDGTQESWAGFQSDHMIEFFARTAGLDIAVLEPKKESRPEPSGQPEPQAEASPAIPARADLVGIDLVSHETQQPANLVMQDQPFEVFLNLELTGFPVEEVSMAGLPYTAQVHARQLGSRADHIICKAEDTLNVDNGGRIKLNATGLPPGIYRIIADLNFDLPGSQAVPIRREGSLLQVC